MKLLNIFLGVPVLSQTTISEIYPDSDHETIPSSTVATNVTHDPVPKGCSDGLYFACDKCYVSESTVYNVLLYNRTK